MMDGDCIRQWNECEDKKQRPGSRETKAGETSPMRGDEASNGSDLTPRDFSSVAPSAGRACPRRAVERMHDEGYLRDFAIAKLIRRR